MGSLKFELIRKALTNNPSLKVQTLCKIALVSRSGYYSHLENFPLKFIKDASSLEHVKRIHLQYKGKKGIETTHMLLEKEGVTINEKKIGRLKRQYDLKTTIRQKNPYKDLPSKSGEHKTIPNILQRNFISPLPDQVYSTDMTYIYYGNCQKAYLSATKDLCTNEIVSYKLMSSPTVSAFVSEFESLLSKIPEEIRSELLIHSDQGYQYTHPAFQETLRKMGVTQSMSRQGKCLDNAPIESFFGHFKDALELWNCKTKEDVQKEIDKQMHHYNVERPQKALNKKPPVEYRGLFSGFL